MPFGSSTGSVRYIDTDSRSVLHDKLRLAMAIDRLEPKPKFGHIIPRPPSPDLLEDDAEDDDDVVIVSPQPRRPLEPDRAPADLCPCDAVRAAIDAGMPAFSAAMTPPSSPQISPKRSHH